MIDTTKLFQKLTMVIFPSKGLSCCCARDEGMQDIVMTKWTSASKCDDKINKFKDPYRNNDSMEAMNYSWHEFSYQRG
jgi:hypothetical protein